MAKTIQNKENRCLYCLNLCKKDAPIQECVKARFSFYFPNGESDVAWDDSKPPNKENPTELDYFIAFFYYINASRIVKNLLGHTQNYATNEMIPFFLFMGFDYTPYKPMLTKRFFNEEDNPAVA